MICNNSVAWCRDNKRAAAGTDDGEVIILEVEWSIVTRTNEPFWFIADGDSTDFLTARLRDLMKLYGAKTVLTNKFILSIILI